MSKFLVRLSNINNHKDHMDHGHGERNSTIDSPIELLVQVKA